MINNPVIGIIGGTGQMGQMFKNFFNKEGLKVLISGRKTKLTFEECTKKSDVVIITVPINKTIEMIKKIGPLVKKDGLLMDLTSIKILPVNTMLKYSNCSVLGTHPVFGPGLNNFEKQTVVLCPGRGYEWQKWYENLLIKNNIKIKICTPEEHDKMMSIIQGLIHFSTISVSHVLKELNIDIKNSLDFSSPIYKLRLDMIGRILNQDPVLYANIEMMNNETKKVLKAYLKSSKKLFRIIKNKKTDKFIDYFNESSKHFGDFKKEAEEYSNYIINTIIKKR